MHGDFVPAETISCAARLVDAAAIVVGKTNAPEFGYPFDFIGSPAASVPAGVAVNDVPVGLQIAARRGNDVTVKVASTAFERCRPWRELYDAIWRRKVRWGE